MPGLRDGFEGYRIASGAELDQALVTSTVVVDANVLLNLYRYTETTRDDLLRVLERLGDRLWIPHQAVTEFWRARLSALSTPAAAVNEARTGLQKARTTTESAISTWAKKASPGEEQIAALGRRCAEFFDGLVDEIDRKLPGDHPMLTTPTDEDPVLRRLVGLLDGRVGHPFDEPAWVEAVAEGRRRAEAGEPPGFRDVDKLDTDLPEGPAGDYLVWRQTLDEASRRGVDVLLVTADEKDDWWWKHRATFLGPRRELVEEFRSVTGHALHMLRPDGLLARSGVLDVSVAEGSVEDAGRSWSSGQAERSAAEDDVPAPAEDVDPWSRQGVDELLRRLDGEGWPHGDVIRAAAEQGGRIRRAQVYEVCGYGRDRTLRGITRPVARLTDQLQHDGVVAPHVQPMLTPHYGTGVTALSFDLPPEVVDILDGEG